MEHTKLCPLQTILKAAITFLHKQLQTIEQMCASHGNMLHAVVCWGLSLTICPSLRWKRMSLVPNHFARTQEAKSGCSGHIVKSFWSPVIFENWLLLTSFLCPVSSIAWWFYMEKTSRGDSVALSRNLQIGNSKSGHLYIIDRYNIAEGQYAVFKKGFSKI